MTPSSALEPYMVCVLPDDNVRESQRNARRPGHTWACLPVGKDSGVEPVHGVLDHLADRVGIDGSGNNLNWRKFMKFKITPTDCPPLGCKPCRRSRTCQFLCGRFPWRQRRRKPETRRHEWGFKPWKHRPSPGPSPERSGRGSSPPPWCSPPRPLWASLVT